MKRTTGTLLALIAATSLTLAGAGIDDINAEWEREAAKTPDYSWSGPTLDTIAPAAWAAYFGGDPYGRARIDIRFHSNPFTERKEIWRQNRIHYVEHNYNNPELIKHALGLEFSPEYGLVFADTDSGGPAVDYAVPETDEEVDAYKKPFWRKDSPLAWTAGTVLAVATGVGVNEIYEEIQDDKEDDKDSREGAGLLLKPGEVFISDVTAAGREVKASLGSSGSSDVSIETFDSSREN